MSLSVGQQLREARQAKKLSLEQAARATRIRLRYLEALEADELDVFPSPVQARGFLKLYANWLGLSLEALLARQREDIAAEPLVSQPPEPTPSSNVEEDEEETSRPISPRRKRVSKRTEPVSTIAPAIPKTEEIPEEQAAQEAAPSPESTTLSQQLFSSIGALLRKQRETLGISLEEAESHVHIRKPVLQILESGAFERLASPVQARGLIQTYARFLDLDVETLLVRFAEALQAQRLERLQHVESKPARSQTRWQLPLKLRRYLSMDVLISLALGVVLIGFLLWGGGQLLKISAAVTPLPTVPPVSGVLIASQPAFEETPVLTETAVGEVTATPVSSELTPQITIPVVQGGAVQLVLIANRNVWVRVRIDGKIAYEGRLLAGTAYPYTGNQQIEVLTGDGAALNVIYKQTDLGSMGAYGEVVNRIYTADGVLVPTLTFTPTPTMTLTSTITPRPSATPIPTATPRFTRTP